MQDREVLAAALERFTGTGLLEPYDESKVAAAARECLAQLPEKCGDCFGLGTVPTSSLDGMTECPACHGRGTVYPTAMFDRVYYALAAHMSEVDLNGWTLAVLDALYQFPAPEEATK